MRSLLLGLLVLALADVAAAQDTSILACPMFTKNAAGATVRVSKCKFSVKAPASPAVDKMCFRRVDTNADVVCASIKPSEELVVEILPATPATGHVLFAAFAIDSDSQAGVLTSAPSDRKGMIIDLDIPTLVKAVIETALPPVNSGSALPTVDAKTRMVKTVKIEVAGE